jgi:O-antigen ligase
MAAMIQPHKFAIAAVILFLALFGGAQFYAKPWGVWFVLIMQIVVVLGMLIKPFHPSPTFLIFFPIFVAILISDAANRDIFQATFSRTLLFIAFLIFILGSHNLLSRPDVFAAGLSLAGAIWPGVYVISRLLGWGDNTNIIAAWSVMFIAVNLAGHNWLILLAHIVMLLWLNSQGAILGAIVAFMIMTQPYWRFSTKTLIMVGLGIMAGLIAWQPAMARIRLYYWRRAWVAFLSNPIFGVGPGGLHARNLIPEWGGGYQVHAHNTLVSIGAELGLIGLAAVAGIIFLITRFRWKMTRWQLAAIAGLLAHSMVDEPLWWPGTLLAIGLIVGSIKCGKK